MEWIEYDKFRVITFQNNDVLCFETKRWASKNAMLYYAENRYYVMPDRVNMG